MKLKLMETQEHTLNEAQIDRRSSVQSLSELERLTQKVLVQM